MYPHWNLFTWPPGTKQLMLQGVPSVSSVPASTLGRLALAMKAPEKIWVTVCGLLQDGPILVFNARTAARKQGVGLQEVPHPPPKALRYSKDKQYVFLVHRSIGIRSRLRGIYGSNLETTFANMGTSHESHVLCSPLRLPY